MSVQLIENFSNWILLLCVRVWILHTTRAKKKIHLQNVHNPWNDKWSIDSILNIVQYTGAPVGILLLKLKR